MPELSRELVVRTGGSVPNDDEVRREQDGPQHELLRAGAVLPALPYVDNSEELEARQQEITELIKAAADRLRKAPSAYEDGPSPLPFSGTTLEEFAVLPEIRQRDPRADAETARASALSAQVASTYGPALWRAACEEADVALARAQKEVEHFQVEMKRINAKRRSMQSDVGKKKEALRKEYYATLERADSIAHEIARLEDKERQASKR